MSSQTYFLPHMAIKQQGCASVLVSRNRSNLMTSGTFLWLMECALSLAMKSYAKITKSMFQTHRVTTQSQKSKNSSQKLGQKLLYKIAVTNALPQSQQIGMAIVKSTSKRVSTQVTNLVTSKDNTKSLGGQCTSQEQFSLNKVHQFR